MVEVEKDCDYLYVDYSLIEQEIVLCGILYNILSKEYENNDEIFDDLVFWRFLCSILFEI